MNAHPSDTYLDKFSNLPWACEIIDGPDSDRAHRAHEDCRGCVVASGAMAVNGFSDGGRSVRHFYESHREQHGLPPLPLGEGS